MVSLQFWGLEISHLLLDEGQLDLRPGSITGNTLGEIG
jgi:hypothetical protein